MSSSHLKDNARAFCLDLTVDRPSGDKAKAPRQNFFFGGRLPRRTVWNAFNNNELGKATYDEPYGMRRVHCKETLDDNEFTYLSGSKYFFQRFVHENPFSALVVWISLFLVEVAFITNYLYLADLDSSTTWNRYIAKERSGWFYANSVLSFVSLLQLLFLYSIKVTTVVVVFCTSCYQIMIFFVSFAPNKSWVSCMYVPFFLRVWPLREYFLLILDYVSIMIPPNRKLDLLRLAMTPLTLFISLVFTASGVFRMIEALHGYPINIVTAIFFIATTVSTVGFGDIVPRTNDSKLFVIIIIIFFLVQMPTFVDAIRSLVKTFRTFRTYAGRRKHFIVYGHLKREDAISILDEVLRVYPMKSVCFINREYASDVMELARHPSYRLRCTFLVADTLDASALRRLQAKYAAASIILPAQEGYSSRVDDSVMLASVIFEQLQPSLPQYLWLRYGLHAMLQQPGNHVWVIDEYMKKNIMACALFLPGVIPFLVNLIRTAWVNTKVNRSGMSSFGLHDWRTAYGYSRRNVISVCPVPGVLVNAPLREVIAAFIIDDVLIVAVQENARNMMYLDLNYQVAAWDTLIAIYEGHQNRLSRALQRLDAEGNYYSAHSTRATPAAASRDNQAARRRSTEVTHGMSTMLHSTATPMPESRTQILHTVVDEDFRVEDMNRFVHIAAPPASAASANAGTLGRNHTTVSDGNQTHAASVGMANANVGADETSHSSHNDNKNNYSDSNDMEHNANEMSSEAKDGASLAEAEATRLRDTLSRMPLVHHRPAGLSLDDIALDQATVSELYTLLNVYHLNETEGGSSPGSSFAEEQSACEQRRALRHIDAVLTRAAKSASSVSCPLPRGSFHRAAAVAATAAGEATAAENQEKELAASAKARHVHESFLVIDQAASVRRKRDTSLYEDIISQTIAQYQLYLMMQCLRSIQSRSNLTLLTLRQHSDMFLRAWVSMFGAPLHYIRGQGHMTSHLNYALQADEAAEYVRGVLVYCSQMGPRDFGDVPIFTVDNNLRELLKWRYAHRTSTRFSPPVVRRDGSSPTGSMITHVAGDDIHCHDQYLVIELESFMSCRHLSPFHSDPIWRHCGSMHFQDSLTFMMGRCFSSNMLLPLMIHSHRDLHVVRFYQMVLNLTSTAEVFEMSEWPSAKERSSVLFRFWICHHKNAALYEDVFDFILRQRHCVCIGVFRRFPHGYGERNARYFITNPPQKMHIYAGDIIYCLDGRST